MSYRVEFGGGAQLQFHALPEHACDALIERAAELAGGLWDAVARPQGMTLGSVRPCSGRARHHGLYLDEDAQLIQIFDILWIG